MVRMAGSLSMAGHLGAFNVAIVDVQAPLQALCESVRPYPARPDHNGLPGAGPAPREAVAAQDGPADIFSVVAEIQRSIDWLSERTASVPDVYTYYAPAGVGVRDPVSLRPVLQPQMAGPGAVSVATAAPRERSAGDGAGPREREEPAAARVAEQPPGVSGLDRDVLASGLAVEQLKGDLAGVTRDLASVEMAMEEIVRLSIAGSVDVSPVSAVEALPGGLAPGAQAAEAQYVGPGQPGLPGRDTAPGAQSAAGEVKRAPISGPPDFVRGLALGAALSNALWGPAVVPARLPAAGQYPAPGAGTPGAPGIDQAPATPFSPAVPSIAQGSPVVRAVETYNTIVNVVKASEAVSGILPTRSASRAEITQYLLAMPGQPADDRQLKTLVDLARALQANVRPAIPSQVLPDQPVDPGPSGGPGLSGDVQDLWFAVRALQDAYDSLAGKMPARADLIGLQKAVEGKQAAEEAAPRLSIAIEGVKTPGSGIDLPDLSPVADQFRQMQTMMARLQVPMYGEGGTVPEPTLALVAETGPEIIVPSRDFTAQIASLNSNYASLWTDVIVLRDGIREIVAGVNDALVSVEAGRGGALSDTDKGYDEMAMSVTQRVADKYLGRFGLTLSDLGKLWTSPTTAGFFTASVGVGGGLGGLYGMHVLKEKLFGKDRKHGEKVSRGREDVESSVEDREEEEFWDLMDKIDAINALRDKRYGKFK